MPETDNCPSWISGREWLQIVKLFYPTSDKVSTLKGKDLFPTWINFTSCIPFDVTPYNFIKDLANSLNMMGRLNITYSNGAIFITRFLAFCTVSPELIWFTHINSWPRGNFSQRTRHEALLHGQACRLKYCFYKVWQVFYTHCCSNVWCML